MLKRALEQRRTHGRLSAPFGQLAEPQFLAELKPGRRNGSQNINLTFAAQTIFFYLARYALTFYYLPMKKVLVLLLITTFGAHAQTNLSGVINSSQTWTLAGSPYIVSGNLVIFEGVDITIEPGVTVKFNSSAGMELRGRLMALGTESENITFTSNLSSPSIGSWNGITVKDTTDPLGVGNQVTMNYVNGMYAWNFINLDLAYHGPYTFSNCYFAHNDRVNYDGGLPSTNFDHCVFESNNRALNWCQFESRVSNSYFYNNVIGLDGFGVVDTCYFSGHTDYAMAPYGVTTGCVIEHNNVGVKTSFNSVNHTFVNNTVANNTIGLEVNSFFNGIQTFTGNTICNNIAYNLKLLSPNNANLGMNCWCSMDESVVHGTIYDGNDNVSYGLVSLSPLSSDCELPLLVGDSEIELDEHSMSAYPNPFKDKVHFRSASSLMFTLQLYDMSGRMVFENTFVNEFEFDGSDIASGMYSFTAKTEAGDVVSGKLVKE